MAANKHTKTELEDVLVRVARMDRLGFHQRDIAIEIGVTQPLICQYLKKIRARYNDQVTEEIKAKRTEKLWEIREARRELIQEWIRSKEDMQKVVTEEEPERTCPACEGECRIINAKTGKNRVCRNCDGTGQVGGVVRTVKTRGRKTADAAFMSAWLKAEQMEIDLLGLNAPVKAIIKSDNTNVNVAVPWDQLASLIPQEVPDNVEEELNRILLEYTDDHQESSNGSGSNGSH